MAIGEDSDSDIQLDSDSDQDASSQGSGETGNDTDDSDFDDSERTPTNSRVQLKGKGPQSCSSVSSSSICNSSRSSLLSRRSSQSSATTPTAKKARKRKPRVDSDEDNIEEDGPHAKADGRDHSTNPTSLLKALNLKWTRNPPNPTRSAYEQFTFTGPVPGILYKLIFRSNSTCYDCVTSIRTYDAG
jgi:hypothetical protein